MLRLTLMSIVVFSLVFGVVALIAAAFVVTPMFRSKSGGGPRYAIGLAGGFAVAVMGLASYAWLGQPQVALSLMGPAGSTDYPALVATLAQRMPNRPGDLEGWMLLGRGYVALRNPDQGAKAFSHAISIARERDGAPSADLLVDYGEALSDASGQVTDEAEAAFKEALMEEPGHLIARYYLGLARAQRSDKAGALQIWQALLSDAPPNAPWRQALVNQVAGLTAETGGGAPNPMAMVAQLAARLEANPDDLNGWLMLINAYTVLGDKEKAVAALAKAKSVFAKEAQAQAALAELAKKNALN